jgi:hypothetical protein
MITFALLQMILIFSIAVVMGTILGFGKFDVVLWSSVAAVPGMCYFILKHWSI